jgi:hypothetical protein
VPYYYIDFVLICQARISDLPSLQTVRRIFLRMADSSTASRPPRGQIRKQEVPDRRFGAFGAADGASSGYDCEFFMKPANFLKMCLIFSAGCAIIPPV